VGRRGPRCSAVATDGHAARWRRRRRSGTGPEAAARLPQLAISARTRLLPEGNNAPMGDLFVMPVIRVEGITENPGRRGGHWYDKSSLSSYSCSDSKRLGSHGVQT